MDRGMSVDDFLTPSQLRRRREQQHAKEALDKAGIHHTWRVDMLFEGGPKDTTPRRWRLHIPPEARVSSPAGGGDGTMTAAAHRPGGADGDRQPSGAVAAEHEAQVHETPVT
jgi:hypothetical protein